VYSARQGDVSAKSKLADIGAGAAVGAGVGAVASALTPGDVVTIPAEAQMDFHLAAPIAVVPVTPAEAQRLAQKMRPGGPVLYVRGETP
jgi:hypothetical protein